MPRFAKCGNPQCFCFGQFQLMESDRCGDCGLPFGRKRGRYFVLLNGPEPKEVVVENAANTDDAAAQALSRIHGMGLDPRDFRVDTIYTPEEMVNN